MSDFFQYDDIRDAEAVERQRIRAELLRDLMEVPQGPSTRATEALCRHGSTLEEALVIYVRAFAAERGIDIGDSDMMEVEVALQDAALSGTGILIQTSEGKRRVPPEDFFLQPPAPANHGE